MKFKIFILFIAIAAFFSDAKAQNFCDASFTFVTIDDNLISFEASSENIGDQTEFMWDFGDGNTSTEANPSHQYSTSGDYTVCLTITDFIQGQSCSDTQCQTVTVDAFIVECSANFTIETNDEGVVTFNPSSESDYYYWDFGDNSPTSTESNPTHEYTFVIQYENTLVQDSSLVTEKFENHFKKIVVPISLGYEFKIAEEWSLTPRAGINLEFLRGNKTGDYQTSVNSTQALEHKSMLISYAFEAEIKKKISKYYLFFSPTYSRTNNALEENDWRQKNYNSWGGKIGVGIKL